MTTANSIVTAQTPNRGHVQIANADASNQKTVYTAGAAGSLVVGLVLVSTDTSARDVQVSITNGGTSYPLGTVSVAAGSGNSSTVASTNGLDVTKLPGLPLDDRGNPYLILVSGDTLTVSSLTTVTSGKLITASALAAGDF